MKLRPVWPRNSKSPLLYIHTELLDPPHKHFLFWSEIERRKRIQSYIQNLTSCNGKVNVISFVINV